MGDEVHIVIGGRYEMEIIAVFSSRIRAADYIARMRAKCKCGGTGRNRIGMHCECTDLDALRFIVNQEVE